MRSHFAYSQGHRIDIIEKTFSNYSRQSFCNKLQGVLVLVWKNKYLCLFLERNGYNFSQVNLKFDIFQFFIIFSM